VTEKVDSTREKVTLEDVNAILKPEEKKNDEIPESRV
jgi:hypothetical protein